MDRETLRARREREQRRKILSVIQAMAKIVWGLAQLRIWELAEDPTYAPFARTLKAATTHLVTTLKDLGIDTSGFEEFEIKRKAQESLEN